MRYNKATTLHRIEDNSKRGRKADFGGVEQERTSQDIKCQSNVYQAQPIIKLENLKRLE